jgi:hypothetical protein
MSLAVEPFAIDLRQQVREHHLGAADRKAGDEAGACARASRESSGLAGSKRQSIADRCDGRIQRQWKNRVLAAGTFTRLECENLNDRNDEVMLRPSTYRPDPG